MNDSDKKTSGKGLKIVLILFTIIALTVTAIGYYLYECIYGHNINLSEDKVITIPDNCSIKQLGAILKKNGIIENEFSFNLTAGQLMSFKASPGKYKIASTIKSNRALVQKLRGSQLSIKLTFHNFRLKEQLAGYVGQIISADSTEIIGILNDDNFLEQYGYNRENVMSLFIPNTYELYWSCTAQQFWERMLQEHKKFWTAERLKKAEDLTLDTKEIYTLASIVECESQYKPERKRIAGVYINRLQKKGWKLEADPTVVFAVGDFGITRVLNSHLEIDSPYNTYKYAGLPPGPIYMASINSIDAVLNYEKHNYMFFCAKPRETGQPNTHAFAKTHRAHINNAKKYWRWLRSIN